MRLVFVSAAPLPATGTAAMPDDDAPASGASGAAFAVTAGSRVNHGQKR